MAEDAKKIAITFSVNDTKYRVETFPMSRLLDILREHCLLTGTKEGCGEGECGTCSVILNGQLVFSCLIPIIQVDGAEVRTIEGIAQGNELNSVQKAFLEKGGAQCGICTPGMVMATMALLEKNPDPSENEICKNLNGNLCRCTGYRKIIDSVKEVGKARREAQ